MPLFHRALGFPAGFRAPKGLRALEYTGHARRAARDDRYGDLTEHLPAHLDADAAQLVEAQTDEQGRRTSFLYRLPATEELDLVMAVAPGETWVVKTVWANRKDDQHRTLHADRYTPVAA